MGVFCGSPFSYLLAHYPTILYLPPTVSTYSPIPPIQQIAQFVYLSIQLFISRLRPPRFPPIRIQNFIATAHLNFEIISGTLIILLEIASITVKVTVSEIAPVC